MPTPSLSGAIPEKIQRPIRERIRFIRESLNLTRHSAPWGTASTVAKIEDVDLSTMQFSALWKMSESMGCSLAETLAALAAGAREAPIDDLAEKQLLTFYRNLKPDAQALILKTTEGLMDLQDKEAKKQAEYNRRNKEKRLALAQTEQAQATPKVLEVETIEELQAELAGREPDFVFDVTEEAIVARTQSRWDS